MKKVITSLMLVCILFISSTISVKAVVQNGILLPPSSVFEGTEYFNQFEWGVIISEGLSVYAVTDADSNVIVDITMDGTTTQYVLYPRESYVHYFNSDGKDVGLFLEQEDGSYLFRIDGYCIILNMTSTADFTGTKVIGTTTTSATGEYMVVVGGSISGTYLAGRHEVTDVASQPLTIMGVNLTNGTVVILDTSSIDSMYVTVIGGQITKVEIEGHLQTNPGNFDTYSIVI